MRAKVGSGDGVTSASIRPATSSTPTSPTATAITALPCSASTCPRGRLPGDTTDQPSRMPAAAARNTAVSSIRPCGVEQTQEDVALAGVEHQSRDNAQVGGVLE